MRWRETKMGQICRNKKKNCLIHDESDSFRWRGRRDLNPRAGFPAYSLSRGAPSASWVLPQAEWKRRNAAVEFGGESGIRTHGPFGSLVFKTSSINHSDISPQGAKAQVRMLSYHIPGSLSTAKFSPAPLTRALCSVKMGQKAQMGRRHGASRSREPAAGGSRRGGPCGYWPRSRRPEPHGAVGTDG